MSMVIREIRKGVKYSLWGAGNESACELLDFLKNLKSNDIKAFDKINKLLDYSVTHGPPRNKEKSKHLTGTDEILELKTGDGVRILWFWEQSFMMICSHGFIKKKQKTPRNEITKAEKTKKDYETAKKNGSLIKIPYKQGKG